MFGSLLLAFEVGDVLEHGVDVAVDFVALAHAIYATYYQTYNASYDYAEQHLAIIDFGVDLPRIPAEPHDEPRVTEIAPLFVATACAHNGGAGCNQIAIEQVAI